MENTQYPEKKQPGLFWRVADIGIHAFSYIALDYILSCCRYAFRHSLMYVLFLTLELFVFFKYAIYLEGIFSKKWLRVLIAVLCIAVSITIAGVFGVLDIAPVLKYRS